MSVAARIWRGTAQSGHHDDGTGFALWRSWPALCVLAVVVRMLLPFAVSDTGMVYVSAAEALVAGDDWAKQALVGALEYPPLPLILTAGIFGVLKLFGAVAADFAFLLLVAGAQVWMLSYVWRTMRLRCSATVSLCVFPIGAAVLAGIGGFSADPIWMMAAPGGAIVFHLMRYEEAGSLRDVAVTGLSAGLLGLCGVVGLAAGIVGVAVFWFCGRGIVRERGGLFLLGMPVIYVAMLVPLANWLVMGHPWFFAERLLAWQGVGGALNWRGAGFALAIAVALACAPKTGALARLTVAWAAVAVAFAIVSAQRGWFLADFGAVLTAAGLACAAGLVAAAAKRDAVAGAVLSALAIALAVPALLIGLPGYRQAGAFAEAGQPPAAEELTNLIDEQWSGSRVLVYDLRTAALYGRHPSARFVARLDYNPWVYQDWIRAEQMHVLVPPGNGVFYPQNHPLLAAAHNGDADSLFLERAFPGGWQLWRCIRPIRKEALR